MRKALADTLDVFPSQLVGLRDSRVVYPISVLCLLTPGYLEYSHLSPVLKYDDTAAIEPISVPAAVDAAGCFVKESLHLHEIKRFELCEIFRKHASSNGRMTKSAFNECVRELIPSYKTELSVAHQKTLSSLLTRIFYAFDRVDSGDVDVDEIATALCCLCEGEDENFLENSFGLMSVDGSASPISFRLFSDSFLTLILALDDRFADSAQKSVQDWISRSSYCLTECLFREADKNKSGRLSFLDFVDWYYNCDGEEKLQFLSCALLDPTSRRVEKVADVPPVFTFDLTDDGVSLELYERDAESAARFVSALRLHKIDAATVIRLFREASSGEGVLERREYDVACNFLMKRVAVESAEIRKILHKIFLMFDRDSHSAVLTDELAVGFTVFVGGSKSTKLSTGYKAFLDGKSYLSPVEFARFLRSYLSVLFALVSATDVEHRAAEVFVELDKAAVFVVASLMEHTSSDNITLKDFGDYYNKKGGHKAHPWLELLSLAKWPVGEELFHDDDEREDEDVDADDSKTVYAFSLTPSAKLRVTENTVAVLDALLKSTCMYRFPLDAVFDVFEKESLNGGLSKASYSKIVASFMRGRFSSASDDEKAFLAHTFDTIFQAYTCDDGIVRSKELLCGFSLLLKGSKSSKLQTLYPMFASSSHGALTRVELARCLRSVLTMLCALAESHSTLDFDATSAVSSASARIATTAFDICTAGETETLSFSVFAEWYSGGGYEKAPFLELLSLKKFPFSDKLLRAISAADGAATRVSDVPPAPVPIAQSSDSDTTSSDDEEDVVFTFLFSDTHPLVVHESDVEHALDLRAGAKLNCDVERLVRSARDSKLDNDFMDANAFADVLIECSDGRVDPDTAGELGLLFDALSRIENTHLEQCEWKNATVLLAFFANGSKSQKLFQLWSLFSTGDDALTRASLQDLLTAVLCALQSIVTGPSMDGGNDDVWGETARSASALVSKVFLATRRADRALLSFEEFAKWYTTGGFETLPWLELLDANKWDATPVEVVPVREGVVNTPANVLYRFELLVATEERLEITTEDTALLDDVLKYSARIDASEMISALKEACDGKDVVTLDSFDIFRRAFLQETAHLPTLDEERERSRVSQKLNELFFACDVEQALVVPYASLGAALLLLAEGSKSTKLSAAFNELMLIPGEVFKHVLISLYVFSGAFLTRDTLELWERIAEASSNLVELVGESNDLEAFAAWWARDGASSAPFLELLDLKKWKSWKA